MRTLLLAVAMGAGLLFGQPNELNLRQDPPPAIQSERVTATYTGTAGATTYYYWIVARYPIGFTVPTAPVIVARAASSLGGGNSVALSWTALTGASSYDVLRTSTPVAPSSCTCAVTLATTSTSVTDSGGALSAWPPAWLTAAGSAQMLIQINNRDAGAPYITMAVQNAQRVLNYQLGLLKNGPAPSYVPPGFIQTYANQYGRFACVDSNGADCLNAGTIIANPVCDGTTDNAAAIQSALNAARAQGGGTVLIPISSQPCGIASQLTVYTGTTLNLQSRDNKIKALSSFPTNTPLVRLGDGTTYTYSANVVNGTIDCNNITGSTGIFSNAAQEQSGYHNMVISSCRTGSKFSGATGVGVSNTSVSNSEILLSVGFAGAAQGHVIEVSSWKHTVSNLTILPNDGATIQADGIYVTYANVIVVDAIHCEYLTNCIKFDGVGGPSSGVVTGADSENSTNLLTIASAGRVSVSGLQTSATTRVLNNTQSGTALTQGTLAFYFFDSTCETYSDDSGSPNQVTTTCPAQVGTTAAGGTVRLVGKSGSSYAFDISTGGGAYLSILSLKASQGVQIDNDGNVTVTGSKTVTKLPTSCSGLAAGTLYNNAGTPAICP